MYRTSFYENDEYLENTSKEFMRLTQGHTYQYYDLEAGDKHITITPTAPHPPHNERWEMCITNEGIFNNAEVLDIGGAEGFYSIKASLLGAKSITMIERSSKAIECAKFICDFLEVQNITFVCQDIRDFKFSRRYDIAFLMRIMHWFNEANSFDNDTRIQVCDTIFSHIRGVCFINIDSNQTSHFEIDFKEHFKSLSYSGEGFMGCIEAWK